MATLDSSFSAAKAAISTGLRVLASTPQTDQKVEDVFDTLAPVAEIVTDLPLTYEWKWDPESGDHESLRRELKELQASIANYTFTGAGLAIPEETLEDLEDASLVADEALNDEYPVEEEDDGISPLRLGVIGTGLAVLGGWWVFDRLFGSGD